MNDETLQMEARVWQRVAHIREVIALIVLLCSPIVGLLWTSFLRLNAQEAEQKQLRRDVDAANLPEKNDRLVKIERDVEWIRKALEAREK